MKEKRKATGGVVREVKGNLRFPLDKTYHGCHQNSTAEAAKGDKMATTVDKICNEALYLQAEARISLIERLLNSLNLPTQADAICEPKRLSAASLK